MKDRIKQLLRDYGMQDQGKVDGLTDDLCVLIEREIMDDVRNVLLRQLDIVNVAVRASIGQGSTR